MTRYRTTSWPGHPLAQADGKVYVHRAVLYQKIGPGDHECHWCRRKLSWDGEGIDHLLADHLNANKWDNEPENLIASCRSCNAERAKNPRFLTHCGAGHEYTSDNLYIRPDNGGRQCRTCAKSIRRARYERSGA